MQVIGTICRLRTGLALLRQKHHTASAWRSLGAEPISAGSRSSKAFPPSRTISGLNGVEATSSPYEAGIAPTGQPLKDSARSSTVRDRKLRPARLHFPRKHCERNTASRCRTILAKLIS